jgi:hypothetical protein
MRRLLSVLLVAVIALASFTGGAAAAESITIIDDQTELTDNTDTVWVDAQAVDSLNGSTFNATVKVTGLTDGESVDNGTVLMNQTISIATDGGTTSLEYALTDGDLDAYDQVHVSVEGDTLNDPDLLASSGFGTTERLSGGGGGTGSSGLFGMSTSTVMIGVLALGGGFLLMKEE